MSPLGRPAHYLVFHPEKKRTALKVRATALVRGKPEPSWSGRVWVDRPPGNEDPFVFGPSWAYSYCHATQLRRAPRWGEEYVKPGSCILFCSGDFAKRQQVLCIDTVFWVGGAHEWPREDVLPGHYKDEVSRQSDLWKFHLRFGGQQDGHDGVYTYEAALYPQRDGHYSRLPLDATGARVSVPFRALPPELILLIQDKLQGRRPVPLSDTEVWRVLQCVEQQTAVEVLGNIVPDDPGFLARRQQAAAGCSPCGRAASSSC